MTERERILLTGAAGYVGSQVAAKLLDAGFDVTGVDSLIYENHPVVQSLSRKPGFNFQELDIHDAFSMGKLLTKDRFAAIVHLAALVGDAASSLSPLAAIRTNYEDTTQLAKLIAKTKNGVLCFASSASVYGRNDSASLDETAKAQPLSLYAWTKLLAEKSIQEIGSSPDSCLEYVIFRFATAYGLSDRMRFDLVVNSFALSATLNRRIKVLGGSQIRPFLSVSDTAEAVLLTIRRRSETKGQVFNIGSNEQNYTINQLANEVQAALPDTEIERLRDVVDERSYELRFDKISSLGFKPSRNVRESVDRISRAVSERRFTDPFDWKYYNSPPTT